MKRRDFLKTVVCVTSVATFLPMLSSTSLAEERRRSSGSSTNQAGSEMVVPNEPTAKAVGYVENFKKSPASGGSKKCQSCALYTKNSQKDGKEIGSCSIFQKKFVYADAYCNSYTKKA